MHFPLGGDPVADQRPDGDSTSPHWLRNAWGIPPKELDNVAQDREHRESLLGVGTVSPRPDFGQAVEDVCMYTLI